jgi:hypothetical protein
MSIIDVTSGQDFASVSAAIAGSASGDVIQVSAGLYTEDFPAITHDLTLAGVGGFAHFVTPGQPVNGKAILVADANVSLSWIELSGATVPDGNGAGLRYEGGALTLSHVWVHDNQDGVLANGVAGGSISIDHSEFGFNGTGDGLTHNLYVGRIGTLTVTDSYFHDVAVGHEIKSRSDTTVIAGNLIADGPTATASFSIDLPNGGNASITGNQIEKGVNSQNWSFIHYGGEAPVYPASSLLISGNSFTSDLDPASSTALILNNQSGTVPARIVDNSIAGVQPDRLSVTVSVPPYDVTYGNVFVAEPASAALMGVALACAGLARRVRPPARH